MALDDRYIVAIDLRESLLDKDTGAPLSGGYVNFFKDDNRTVPKLVYELSGAPPNYTYSPLPDPIILNAIGSFQDAGGNDVPVYYFPFDAEGNIELYYIEVYNANGVLQFTRQAWPNLSPGDNPADIGSNGIVNQLSNPQFVDVLFDPTATLTISFSGSSTTTVAIAPDWNLNIIHTGTGTVQVSRSNIAGISAYPTNPPYVLNIVPGLNISGLTLSQRLNHNPDIWSPATAGIKGYAATAILLSANTSVTIQYVPSQGAAQTLLTANNTSGAYELFTNTIELNPATNTDTADVGYVDIIINLSITQTSNLSSIQVVGLDNNQQNIDYQQSTVNRQIDQLFNYYNSRLQYKPIPSHLIGWNFQLNPAQFAGYTVGTFATGANTSNYVWDQTIIFQSANNGFIVAPASWGAFILAAQTTTQLAIIQYLPTQASRQVLDGRLSVNIIGASNIPGGITGKVTLWYTKDASLPAMGSSNSLIATLDSTGKPATFNGNWIEVPRSNLGDATFKLTSPPTLSLPSVGLSGWDLNGSNDLNTLSFFAIVVGFPQMVSTNDVYFKDISLVDGDIPTPSGAQTQAQVVAECQYFYEKSFNIQQIPATAVGVNTGEYRFSQALAGGTIGNFVGNVNYRVLKNPYCGTPSIIIYNPRAANNQVTDLSSASDCSSTGLTSNAQNGFGVTVRTAPGSAVGDINGFHWTSDYRLGF